MTDTARGVDRARWEQLPGPVRGAVEERLGARVVGVGAVTGGFSHGMAARLELGDGRAVFGKAIRTDDRLIESYRTEAATGLVLPPGVPAPRMLFSVSVADWLVMVFEFVAGRHPRFDRPAELIAAIEAVECALRVSTPAPVAGLVGIEDALGPSFTAWRDFSAGGPPADLDPWARAHLDELAALESQWSLGVAGDTLLHNDLRPDNMLLRADGTVALVDWAWTCRGAAWVDLACLLPELLDAGADPDRVLTRPLVAAVDPRAIDALCCALCGFWERNSRLPAPAHRNCGPFRSAGPGSRGSGSRAAFPGDRRQSVTSGGISGKPSLARSFSAIAVRRSADSALRS
ncbi:phosphotransferase [Nocardia sp. NPDC057668]|uniref:phosphotransferase n=1 Tax=Nocardia sp. NPDC057668 TaxID=3346202 RepID=UPI00366ACF16